MTSFTSHFRFGIPDFTQEPWHETFEALVHAIDTAIYQAIVADSVVFWDNATDFEEGRLVIDEDTGVMYVCAVDHTSAASPTTFAQDRAANPSYWTATANVPQQRGNWVTATTYQVGDFVIDSERYAVCIVGHVSGVFNTDLAGGKWSVLIDLSSLGVGMNTEAEATIAAGATVDLGGETATRILVDGDGETIGSFGIVANQLKVVRYNGVNTITHSADIILPGGDDRVTDDGGIQWLSSDSTGKWRELMWHQGSAPSALPVASTTQQGIVELATTAEAQALADTDRAVTPSALAGVVSDLTTSILNTIRGGVSSSLDTLAEIATAIGLLAPKASPVFTGDPTAPTPSTDDSDTSVATTAMVHAVAGSVLWVREEQTAGTDGGTFTSGADQTRNLNVTKHNGISGASVDLGANTITLPAGTYEIFATCPAFLVDNHKAWLSNDTDASEPIIGTIERCATTDLSSTRSIIMGVFTIAAQKVFSIKHRCSTTRASDGFGEAGGLRVEVYTDVMIWKL